MEKLDLICYELEQLLVLNNMDEIISNVENFIQKYPHLYEEYEKAEQVYQSVAGLNGKLVYAIVRTFICSVIIYSENNDLDSFFKDIVVDNSNISLFDSLNLYMSVCFLYDNNSRFSFLFKKQLESEKIIKIIDSAIEVIKNKELYEYYTLLYIKLIFIANYLYNRSNTNYATNLLKNFLQRKNKYYKIKIKNELYHSFMTNVFALDKIITKLEKTPKNKLKSYDIVNVILENLQHIKQLILSNNQ